MYCNVSPRYSLSETETVEKQFSTVSVLSLSREITGIRCDIDTTFRIQNAGLGWIDCKPNDLCLINAKNIDEETVELRWPKESTQILGREFNFGTLIEILEDFRYFLELKLHNLKGFEVDLLPAEWDTWKIKTKRIENVFVVNSLLDFYVDVRGHSTQASIPIDLSNFLRRRLLRRAISFNQLCIWRAHLQTPIDRKLMIQKTHFINSW